MSVINTNTISLNAQRNLQNNSASLATTIQRLSSGLRINSARDDAAGLAISERFSTQIRGLNVAVRNANDGISLAQTAEGGLSEVSNNLQRIRELAVQSANATNSASDRKALDAEVQALKSEIDRVASQAEFNGTKLLDGSFQGQLFQVGTQGGQAISLGTIQSARVAELGTRTGEAVEMSLGAFTSGQRLTASETYEVTFTAGSDVLSFDTNDVSFGPFITAQEISTALQSEGFNADGSGTVSGFTLDLGGEATIEDAVANGSLVVARSDGVSFTRVETAIEGFGPGAWSPAPSFAGATTSIAGAGSNIRGFESLNLLDVEASTDAILAMDAALTAVNAARADLGAVQNRFSSVVANLNTSSENLSASRSRIRDTDYAKETAELTRTQILQQAGTALLAQANQIPQNVLSLLR